MVYTNALQAPNRQQWETSSLHSQSWNCGPTCVSFIAGFYNDSRPAIEYNRRLISGLGPYSVNGEKIFGSPPRTPTNAWQQADMLRKRGVACTPRSIDSVAELHGLVDNGRRPTLIGIEMSRVPAAVRGHSFPGWHAVVVITGGYRNGARGFWIMDPNFADGSPESRRWYSDSVMQSAWANNSPRWGVVPTSMKPTANPPPTTYVQFNSGVNGVNIRGAPDSRVNNIFAIAYADPKGIIRYVNGAYIASTSQKRQLFDTIRGVDGLTYYKIKLPNTIAYVYVNSNFMHRV